MPQTPQHPAIGRMPPGRPSHAQRGFLLITAVVLIVVVALLMSAMVYFSATGNQSTASFVNSKQALFIAESGIERGIREWGLNNGYTGETMSFANGSFTLSTADTDFSGNPLSSGRIRIRSVGTASGNATRTVEAIAGPENLLPPAANANFNADAPPPPPPLPPCPYGQSSCPDGWSLSADPPGSFVPWDNTGGPDGSRAAYAEKPSPGNSTATNAGNFTFSPPVVVVAPTTLNISFDYKVVTSGKTSQELQLTFGLADSTTTWTSNQFDSGDTGAYQSGNVSIDITGTGTVSISNLTFTMYLKSGQPKQAWLDNIALGSGGGSTKLQIKSWREVFP